MRPAWRRMRRRNPRFWQDTAMIVLTFAIIIGVLVLLAWAMQGCTEGSLCPNG